LRERQQILVELVVAVGVGLGDAHVTPPLERARVSVTVMLASGVSVPHRTRRRR
jgi:hypothetical protein